MVSRDPQDRGETRLMDTPGPSILIDQLNRFFAKVEVEYKGWTPSAIKEAQNLKLHVKRMSIWN